jgi:hypothetical protein
MSLVSVKKTSVILSACVPSKLEFADIHETLLEGHLTILWYYAIIFLKLQLFEHGEYKTFRSGNIRAIECEILTFITYDNISLFKVLKFNMVFLSKMENSN